MGGTGKIVYELEKLMMRNNIKIQKNTDVEKIIVDNRKVTGVKLINGEIINRCSNMNADPPTVYKEMLEPKHRKYVLPKSEKVFNIPWDYSFYF